MFKPEIDGRIENPGPSRTKPAATDRAESPAPLKERERLIQAFDQDSEATIPSWVQDIFANAEALYARGHDSEALSLYLRVLSFLNSDSPIHFTIFKNIGNIFVRAGDFDSAEENYNKAYALKPDSDVLMVNYGTLEIQRGAFDKALTCFRRAVDLNPQNDKGWVGLALIHREYGDFDLCWANLERALDENPLNETAITLVANWSHKDHREERAIPRLNTYMELRRAQY